MKQCNGSRGFNGRDCGAMFTGDGPYCGRCRERIRRNNSGDGDSPLALRPEMHRYTRFGELVVTWLHFDGVTAVATTIPTGTYAAGGEVWPEYRLQA